MRRLQRRTRGAGLPVAMLLLLVAFTAVAAVARSVLDDTHDGLRERAELRALHVGDGGLAAARVTLARDPAYVGGEVTVGNQVVTVAVETLATDTRRVVAETSIDVPGGAGLPVRRRFEQTLRLGGGLPTVTGWRELH